MHIVSKINWHVALAVLHANVLLSWSEVSKANVCIFWKSLLLLKPLICPTDLHEAIFQ